MKKGSKGGGTYEWFRLPAGNAESASCHATKGDAMQESRPTNNGRGYFFLKWRPIFIFGAKMARPHSAVALCAALLVSLAGAGVCVCVRVQVLMPASACILSADARTLPLGSYCGAALTVRARAPL